MGFNSGFKGLIWFLHAELIIFYLIFFGLDPTTLNKRTECGQKYLNFTHSRDMLFTFPQFFRWAPRHAQLPIKCKPEFSLRGYCGRFLKLPNHLYADFLTLLCSVFAFTVWGLKRSGKFISRLFKKKSWTFLFYCHLIW